MKKYIILYNFLNTPKKVIVYSLFELNQEIERILNTPEILDYDVEIKTEEK